MAHREFKDRLYPQFARVGGALSSEKRLELLDLLAQAPRNVEALANETGMSVANTSQHLQVLRAARLVESDRRGTWITYRLAGEAVLRLWLALRSTAETRLPDIDQITREFVADRDGGRVVSREELERILHDGSAYVIDVRPSVEYEAGHLPGALTIPIEELAERLSEVPRDRPVVAYCRGEYCLFADDAVRFLRAHGIDASRLEGGWPEWLLEGRGVVTA
jgi:rhodanese-related sulfurtransferase/DNA-binding transcriptional ArsR family regulator